MQADVNFWLILAGTLALGWAVTSYRNEKRRQRRHRRRARYLEGVRFLLDDKPDRALEAFLTIAELDDETVDTHFALGSLYRRRGEVDRAIRVHQHIYDKASLDDGHRDAALTELARDYFRAGLFDRAEKLFLELADGGREPALALQHLVRIYEIQHEWAQAAAAHERLRTVGVPEQPAAIAHYYCEMAEAEIARAEFEAALEHLRSASREQQEFGRAGILRGDVARKQGDPALALQLYRRVVRRDFHLLAVVLPRLADAARHAGEPQQFDETLEELIRLGAGNHAEIAYAAIVGGYYDDPVILRCVREMLTIDNDLRDMTAAFLTPGVEPSPDQLRAIAGALRNVVLRHARYKCSQCGLDSSTFLWHCPGCHSWDTLRGVAALEFLPKAALPRAPH
ncbi:MAG TPA: tetratricopeptide repeat protein [Steroidobacteraceae bacterium]|nr:tetratricopeptide repeat protein [Steroidobacteraceae bacterium]